MIFTKTLAPYLKLSYIDYQYAYSLEMMLVCPVLKRPVKSSQVIIIVTHHIHAAHPGLSIASGHGSLFLGLILAITRLRRQIRAKY